VAAAGAASLRHFAIVVEHSELPLTSDAGLLPLRQFDAKVGLSEQLARALHDPRAPQRTQHSFAEMLRSRLFAILADYHDQNDHDTLRSDPVFKLIAGRAPHGDDLASQPTLSRFENGIDIASLKRLRDVLIDQFIASFAQPPQRLLFDLDAVDDPAHGAQQLVLFHGFYDQYQYLPLIVTCADTDQVVLVSLRPGNAHAALGADDDLDYLVGRLRQTWPDVPIEVRGDAGFGMPWMYAVCEGRDLLYTFGLSANPVLHRASEALLAQAVARFEQTGQGQRLFDGFWYQAGSWPAPRWVIVKAEANARGTNRRYIVTNRPGARVLSEAAYDAYAGRGESENRNKELKVDLQMDRLSDHRFVANYFRLYLHASALNLLVRLRREVAELPAVSAAAPPEEKKRQENRRRREDPLGEGQPCTWRSRLIKVAAVVTVSCRRVWVRLSGVGRTGVTTAG
jgi:hypothetical protein